MLIKLLIVSVVVGRFLVFSFFTCDQATGGLNEVTSRRVVNGGSSGWVACCWGRVSWQFPRIVPPTWLPPAAPSS